MKTVFLCLLCCVYILMSSCSHHFYAPALYHQDIAYQPKPTSFDSVKSSSYLSGGLNMGTDPTGTDFSLGTQINYSRAHVFDKLNLAYGVFGVFGDYPETKSDPDTQTELITARYFGAVGGRISANLYTKKARSDFRYLGVEAAYSHEYGQYANYRRRLKMNYSPDSFNDPVDANVNLLTIGLTSEIIFHSENKPKIQQGIRLFLGSTIGNHPSNSIVFPFGSSTVNDPVLGIFNTIHPKLSYYLKFKKSFAVIDAGNQILVRYGYTF